MSARPEACPLCNQPVLEPSVAVAGGGRAHLACAERAAQAAWRRRRHLALAHLATIAAALALLVIIGAQMLTLGVTGVALVALHLVAHQRFWSYLARDLRSYLRGRRSR